MTVHFVRRRSVDGAFGAEDGQSSRLSFTKVEAVMQLAVVGLIGFVPHTRTTLLWLSVTVRR